MALPLDQIPGYAGYAQREQANQQQSLASLMELAKVQDVLAQRQNMRLADLQYDAAKRKQASDDIFMQALKDAQAQQSGGSVGLSQGPTATGQVGPTNANLAVGQAASKLSAADVLLIAAQKAGNAEAYRQAMAMKLEEKKLGAKWATEPRTVMGPDGKPVLVQMADDGSVRPIQGGYGAAEKLHFADNGQMAGIGIDPYTGRVLSPGVQKQQSPDSIASNQVAIRGQNMTAGTAAARLNFEKSQVGKPTFNADAGGFIVPPSATNPQGAIMPLPGFSPKMTEAQSKDALFGSRAARANEILNRLESGDVTNPGLYKQLVSGVPLVGGVLGSAVNSMPTWAGGPNEFQQQTEQARRDFINAVLRKESGAVISPQEFANAEQQYFPQPGDSQTVMEQKRKNRELAIQGIGAGAGSGQTAVAKAQAQGAAEAKGIKTPVRNFTLDDGSKIVGTLGKDGNYYVTRNGKQFRVEE